MNKLSKVLLFIAFRDSCPDLFMSHDLGPHKGPFLVLIVLLFFFFLSFFCLFLLFSFYCLLLLTKVRFSLNCSIVSFSFVSFFLEQFPVSKNQAGSPNIRSTPLSGFYWIVEGQGGGGNWTQVCMRARRLGEGRQSTKIGLRIKYKAYILQRIMLILS